MYISCLVNIVQALLSSALRNICPCLPRKHDNYFDFFFHDHDHKINRWSRLMTNKLTQNHFGTNNNLLIRIKNITLPWQSSKNLKSL